MARQKQIDWKWLLIGALSVGWSLTTYILGASALDQRSRFASRNEVDVFAEFSLVAGATIEQIAADFEVASPATGVCIGNLSGVKNFLDNTNEKKLLSDSYFYQFDSDDNIARVVLIYSNQNFHIFYIQYLSLDAINNQVGCLPINSINWEITAPKITAGKPKLGEIK